MSDTQYYVYIGTYAPKDQFGIHLYSLDATTGHLALVESVSGIENPSFLALSAQKHRLYAVSEIGEGKVASYAIDPEQKAITFQAEQETLGGAPCYVTLNKQETHLLVANYAGGNVNLFSLREDGTLGDLTYNVKHAGKGPREDRQEGPHPHSVVVDPTDQFAFVPDLGLDSIVTYKIDYAAQQLVFHAVTKLQPGAGPRHFVFHSSQKLAYVINELDSTITAFAYDATTAHLEPIQTIATLPADFAGVSTCADIHISPNGNFVYASNRGHDSIAVYSIDAEAGTLTLVEHVSTQGNTPRNFALSPDGMFLLVANQDSNSIVTYIINEQTGQLTPTGETVSVLKPVCLKILPAL